MAKAVEARSPFRAWSTAPGDRRLEIVLAGESPSDRRPLGFNPIDSEGGTDAAGDLDG